MKTYYTTFIISLMTLLCTAQGYEFGIVHISNYDFKVVAIPDFDSAGNTDISDVGFTLMLPAGTANVINQTGLLGARTWSIQEVDAATLQGFGGDGTIDAFLFNLPPGQSILSHTNGQQIDLVSFQIDNSPVTGEMSFLLNTDPIAINLVGALNSFYNTDLDGPGGNPTGDYFSGLAIGIESFSFSSLGIEDNILLNSITIYPNPASEIIHISSSINIEEIKMFDVLGKQVLTSFENKQLKVDHLQSGIYFLKLFTNKGSATKKIIIE